MKYISSLFIFFLSICSQTTFAQEMRHELMPPGRTMESNKPKSYSDSAEFTNNFKLLYPTIKPAQTVHEAAEVHFKALSRTFKMQGIDSAEAAKAAFKNIDDSAFYKMYYDTYRRNLSAKELKKYTEFIKTTEGKHIAEVWTSLQSALPSTTSYIAHTINLNLTPIRQAAREKMEKEQPPKKPDQNKPPLMPKKFSGSLFDQNNAASSDSLMRLQRMQNKIPPVNIPVDTSHGK